MPYRFAAAMLAVCFVPPLAAQSEAPAAPPAEKQVVVVAAKVPDLAEDHYLWAAEMAAARLQGKPTVLEGGLAGGLRHARENPGTVRGIVEIMIDVHSWDEEVRITCYDTSGREVWKDKAKVNMGGSEEALARKMLDRALKKAEKRPACGQ